MVKTKSKGKVMVKNPKSKEKVMVKKTKGKEMLHLCLHYIQVLQTCMRVYFTSVCLRQFILQMKFNTFNSKEQLKKK